MLKRFITFILLIGATIFTLNSFSVKAANFSMDNIEVNYRSHDGVSNVERFVNMSFRQNTKSRFNVLEFDNSDEDIHLVTISNYSNFAWGMTPLRGMIESFERQNPHLTVLGGVNGDFYDINNTGQPSSTYVEDYEVVKGSPRGNTFNIKSDRTFDISVPTKDGYELLVIDRNNEVKFRKKLDKFNETVTNKDQVGVYLNTYTGTVDKDLNPILINAEDIKFSGTFERAKGYVSSNQSDLTLTKEKFLIFADGLKLDQTDRVLVQHKLVGYEDVRATMGGGNILVQNGKVEQSLVDNPSSFAKARAPRTAVGIKADGSPFFIVANGRNETLGIPGTNLEETAHLLLQYGAVSGLNLDGGGSSTMVMRNVDGELEVLNELSDGRERSISNGILIVRGDINEKPINMDRTDTRNQFATPKNVFIDHENILHFDYVNDVTRYIVTIGDRQFETSKNTFDLNSLSPGEHNISVRSKSNLNGTASKETETLKFIQKEFATNELMEWLKNFSKNLA